MIDLSALLPHQGPMRWVEGPLEANERSARVVVRIPAQSALFGPAPIPAYAALEYIAQAAAAHAGWQAAQHDQAPRAGQIASCRRLCLEVERFERGWELAVEAHWIAGEGEARAYRGEVRKLPDGALLAQADLTLVLT